MKDHRCKTMPDDVRIYWFDKKYTNPKTRISFWCIEKPIPKQYQIIFTIDSSGLKNNKCPYCKEKLEIPK